MSDRRFHPAPPSGGGLPEDLSGADIDARIAALFGGQPWQAVEELSRAIERDEELEEQLIDLFQVSVDTGTDPTVGTAGMAVVLGEARSAAATGPLVLALDSPDELVVAAAVRGLRRIGAPAIDALLDLLESDELDDDLAQAILESLESSSALESDELRERIEAGLMRELLRPEARPRRRESAALALARIGVARSKEVIEHLLETEFPAGNAFLIESLEILDENPEGIPSPAETPWQRDLQWADSGELPGGELEPPEEAAPEDN